MTEFDWSQADIWPLLKDLPIQVEAAASVADAQKGTGSTREILTAINTFLTGAMLLRHNPLVQAVFNDYKEDGQGEARLLQLSQDPPPDLIEQTLANAGALAGMLDGLERSDDVLEFKNWLSSMATEIVYASTEGGFLGIGGTRVTEGEDDFLQQLNRNLGLGE